MEEKKNAAASDRASAAKRGIDASRLDREELKQVAAGSCKKRLENAYENATKRPGHNVR